MNFYEYVGNNPLNGNDPTGMDLTPAQQVALTNAARNWVNAKVPYVTGGSAKKGADCSGAVSGIYAQAGIPIGRLTSWEFAKSPYFRRVTGVPQIGDVGSYPGHVDLYGGNTGKNRDVWSASHPGGRVFGAADSSWYGKPTWYRYFPDSAAGAVPNAAGTTNVGLQQARQPVTSSWEVSVEIIDMEYGTASDTQAEGGYVIYPNKPNTNMMNIVYSK